MTTFIGAQQAALPLGLVSWVAFVKSPMNMSLNKFAVQMCSENPLLANGLALTSFILFLYTVMLSSVGQGDKKQVGSDGDQPVLVELNNWMAQEMYLSAKVNLFLNTEIIV